MGKETLNCRAMAYSADLIIKTELYSKEEKKEVNYSSNDLDIIQSLYDEYANDLLLYGLKMGYNRDILEDAIHDIFIDVVHSID